MEGKINTVVNMYPKKIEVVGNTKANKNIFLNFLRRSVLNFSYLVVLTNLYLPLLLRNIRIYNILEQ